MLHSKYKAIEFSLSNSSLSPQLRPGKPWFVRRISESMELRENFGVRIYLAFIIEYIKVEPFFIKLDVYTTYT
jgi:hypothetical protein